MSCWYAVFLSILGAAAGLKYTNSSFMSTAKHQMFYCQATFCLVEGVFGTRARVIKSIIRISFDMH